MPVHVSWTHPAGGACAQMFISVSINHGFLIFAKMQSKSTTGSLRGSTVNQSGGNLNAYRIARAKARRDVRLSKKTSQRNYISKLNSQALVKSVWNRIQKIKGMESTNSIHHLSVNDRDVTLHRDIANALADNSRENHYGFPFSNVGSYVYVSMIQKYVDCINT